jgi:putative Mg2+ transporter-C (MgtC) family protein
MPLVQRIHEVLMSEMSSAGVYLLRLVMAALLGGAIGLEREIKHRPSGLRTNLFICVGAALFYFAVGCTGGPLPRRPHPHSGTDHSGIGFIGQVPFCTIGTIW